jgi:hypothetical protein
MSNTKQILKDALVDAKTVRETALAQAKLALEEAFTPTLTALFAERLNELELEEAEAEKKPTDETMDETYSIEEEELEEDFSLEELLAELEMEETVSLEELLAELEEEQEPTMEGKDMDTGNLEEDLMLEELSDEEIEELVVKTIEDMIASGKLMAGEDDEENEEDEEDMEDMDDMEDMEDTEDEESEEEIDIDEILAEIEVLSERKKRKKDGKEEDKKAKKEKDEDIKALEETINVLKHELNEINLLNAKLLYTNKIFKAKNLTESEKIKVLNTFDKAETVKEVKLVFETLTESFKAPVAKKNPIKESLGSASKSISTATPKQPIIEVNNAFARMQQLAGLKK